MIASSVLLHSCVSSCGSRLSVHGQFEGPLRGARAWSSPLREQAYVFQALWFKARAPAHMRGGHTEAYSPDPYDSPAGFDLSLALCSQVLAGVAPLWEKLQVTEGQDNAMAVRPQMGFVEGCSAFGGSREAVVEVLASSH